ncbi:MAG: carboxypeptidase regulatory-like domain-containing protein [Planctomycetes bacterium]|nr:carboxypeptidase regulatory-like domain-containing protein [Planctomycetota bacterium]
MRTTRVGALLLGLAALLGSADGLAQADDRQTSFRLRVRVLAAEDGKPLAGATIAAVPPERDDDAAEAGWTQIRRVTTDVAGDASIDSLPRVNFRLVVRSPDRVRQVVPLQIVADCTGSGHYVTIGADGTSEVVDVRVPGGVAVTGRVIDAAITAPVAGATVTAFAGVRIRAPRRSEFDVAETTTAADGSFRLAGLPPGEDVWVVVEAAGWTIAEREVTAPGSGDAAVPEFFVAAAGRVEGVVAAPDGKPAAGAFVYAALATDPELVTWPERSRGSGRHDPHAHALRSTSGADGRFEVAHLVPGASYSVWAVAGARLASRTAVGVTASAGGRLHQDLRLEPLIDADLVLALADGTALNYDGEPEVEPLHEKLAATAAHRAYVDRFGTDSPLRLRRTHPGRHRLVLAGYDVLDQTVDFEVPANPATPVRVVVAAGAQIRGVVVDQAGRPIVRAGLWCEPVEAQVDGAGETRHCEYAETRDDGTFFVTGLATVPYLVQVLIEGRPVLEQQVTPPLAALRLTVGDPDLPATVRFRIPPPSSGPTLGAWVMARDGRDHDSSTWGSGSDAKCGASPGEFTFEVAYSGEVWLEFTVKGWAPLRRIVRLTAGESLDLGPLERPASVPLAGRVLDRTGRPIAGARVLPYWRDDLGARTGDAGEFVAPAVLPGTVTGGVFADGYPRQEFSAPSGDAPIGAAIVLLRGGTLRGRVVNADGAPWPGDVRAYVPSLLGAGTHQVELRTGADGRFESPALPGTWRVEAKRGETVLATAIVVVEDEKIADAVVTLPAVK